MFSKHYLTNINVGVSLIFALFPQQDRIIPADPISGSEKIKTLKRLDQVIQQRLITSKLPPQMSNLVIGKALSSTAAVTCP